MITLPTILNIGLKMKQGSDDIFERHIIYIHPINQSYEKMITFMKRQAVASLIILNKKKTNKINK